MLLSKGGERLEGDDYPLVLVLEVSLSANDLFGCPDRKLDPYDDAARKNSKDGCAPPFECVDDPVANARVTGNSKRLHPGFYKRAVTCHWDS